MATIREIKRRISAVKSTQKITRAMKLVAAAKLRRAQENILKARPYAVALDRTLSHITMITKRDSHPLLAERQNVRKILLVVVTSDTGLCGGFNASLIRRANAYLEANNKFQVDLFCIGRKGKDFFNKSDFSLVGHQVMFFNKLKYFHAVTIICQLQDLFLKKGYDRVDILYNEFKSVVQQSITIKQLLPLVSSKPELNVPQIEYLYEPGEYEVLNTLIPYNLEVQIWRILLESYAAEMGAKMTAMDSATENAKDLLSQLMIHYNRVRQQVITREISEIVGASNGMSS